MDKNINLINEKLEKIQIEKQSLEELLIEKKPITRESLDDKVKEIKNLK